jgi:hypothetical protein
MITKYKLYEALKKSKVNFEWEGIDKIFNFKNITINKEYGYVPMMGISQVIRQYIKQKWNVPFQIGSETYSGGSTIRIYLDPQKINDNVYNDIDVELKLLFQSGNFNGMDDSYEYGENKFEVIIDDKKFKFTATYIMVEHKPKYGTKEYVAYEEWKRMNDEASKFNL